MVSAALVERKIRAGRKLVDRLKQEGFGLVAALWLLLPESEDWTLILASRIVDDEGPLLAYERIQSVLTGAPNVQEIQLSEISVRTIKDPLITGLRRMGEIRPIQGDGVWLHHSMVNGAYLEEAFVYRLD